MAGLPAASKRSRTSPQPQACVSGSDASLTDRPATASHIGSHLPVRLDGKKAPPRTSSGGASICSERLLLRATSGRIFRLIFLIHEIDQPAIGDRGDARRGLLGYAHHLRRGSGRRPLYRNKSVIVTVGPHNDLAGRRGRRDG